MLAFPPHVPPPAAPARWASRRELADAFGVSERTVDRWRAQGCPSLRLRSGSIRFSVAEVEAWHRSCP